MCAAFLAKSPSFVSRCALFAAILALGGCSGDARRLAMPWNTPASNSSSSNTVAWNNAGSAPEYTGSITPAGNVKSQNLPPVSEVKSASADIVVDQGDTLYSIARKYGIPASALMKANNIYDAGSVKVGQRLKLPEGARVQVASSAPFAASAPDHDPSGHVVVSGDTLSSISRKYNVSPGELARANDFGPRDSIRVGQRLNVPRGAQLKQAKAEPPKPVVKEQKPALAEAPRAEPIAEDPVQVARAEPAQKPAEEATASLPDPAPMNSTEFRWPVRGRIVQNFGLQQGGGKNDGINIAVPSGTPVKAAENGVVAYAGAELKGYGQLVLIRHDNDFVTAYAHNSKLSVKRGDKVTRGQVIAEAGSSGNVSQPQLHFEIRKGSSPIDPLTHLSGM